MPNYRSSVEENTAFRSLLQEIFGQTQIFFRDCPSCGGKRYKVTYMTTGKDMVPSLMHTFGLAQKTIKHLPLMYNRCTQCGLFFISPTPPLSNIDFFRTTPGVRKRIRKEYNETRKNIWMEEQSYIDDKMKTMSFHYKKMRFSAFPRKAAILDIGCGTGVGLEFFYRKGWKLLYGIDPDYYSVSYIRKHKPFIKSFWADIYSFSVKKYLHFFDLIMLDNSLEHHTEPKKVIEICSKMLKKKGMLWIAVPNIAGNSIKKKGTKDDKLNWGHWSYFSPESCMYLLRDYFDKATIYDTYLYRTVDLHRNNDLSDFQEDFFQVLVREN